MDNKPEEFTQEQINNYLRRRGTHCPYCDSIEVVSGPIEYDGDDAWASVHCWKCDRYWIDVYQLVSIEPDV